jgi:1-aminocyclopropane-1-carboxylate deaminase/D-cysteine desulfhydrase-like pyridoxal-dependent ACC family enzyme
LIDRGRYRTGPATAIPQNEKALSGYPAFHFFFRIDRLAHLLHQLWPALETRVPAVALGDLPTPVEPLMLDASGGPELFVKRDDLSSSVYGGNKVRTLEVLFGAARSAGATHVYATGAFGSNHAVATILHAKRAGLLPGALLFPQPPSRTAAENLVVSAAHAHSFVALPHWSLLPFGIVRLRARASERAFVMVPGGATPLGALGYIAAAFELARQVASGVLPLPESVVVGVGSTCTSAGLLAGMTLAARLGVAGDPSLRLDRALLGSRLTVDGRYLGRGYGFGTEEGDRATALFAAAGGPPLDSTYSGKSAACVIAARRALPARGSGPTLYWATKSSAPLPSSVLPDSTPRAVRRFLERAEGAARRLYP